jgi:hypothetical protein
MRPVHLHLDDFAGPPHTTLGWWSIALELAFLVALGATAAWLALGFTAADAPLTAPILAALAATAVVGISVGLTAAIAILRKGERSVHDVLSLLLGGMVLFIVARQLI